MRGLRSPLSSEGQDRNHGDNCYQWPADKGAGHRRFHGLVVSVGREEFNRGHRPEQADDVTEDRRQQSYANSFHGAIRYGVNGKESTTTRGEWRMCPVNRFFLRFPVIPLRLRIPVRLLPTTQYYDIIIIGIGPGGGTLAYRLAPPGKKILLLERGGYLPREKEK